MNLASLKRRSSVSTISRSGWRSSQVELTKIGTMVSSV